MDRPPLALRLGAIALSIAAVTVVPAGLVLDDRLDRSRHSPRENREASATSQPTAMTLVGHEVLGVKTTTFPPGHTEAWGEDFGLHAVSVIAGTLPVQSVEGTPVSYGAGQGYVAGWAPYLVLNDGSVPVEVDVTRLARREAGPRST